MYVERPKVQPKLKQFKLKIETYERSASEFPETKHFLRQIHGNITITEEDMNHAYRIL